jgi:AcrR family transcriptional regulator
VARKPLSDEALLDAAAEAIGRYGLAGATLERIAAAAGVSRVTLHRRGVDRAALVGGLAARAEGEFREALWPALTASGTGAERLERALRAMCAVADHHTALLLGMGGAATDAVFHEAGPQGFTRATWTDPLERLLRDGAADGTLRDLPPRQTATVLFNLVGWTYVHLRSGHGWTPERALEATLDVALSGVAHTT